MRSRSLLSSLQREQAVVSFEQGYGPDAVASRLEVPSGRVKRLYERWRIHDRLCLMEKPTKAQYSFETKKAVVERFLAGETKPDLAHEYRLSSPKLIEAWVRRYRADGDAGLRPQPKGRPRSSAAAPRKLSEIERVRRENERLRAENAYLKKVRDLRDQGRA